MRSHSFHSSYLFHTGQSLVVDFGLCAPTRLIFLTLVSHCWWTLTCALPLVFSFSYWSVTRGGLWFVCSHSSCLFDIGQSLLVDFDLCAPTRLHAYHKLVNISMHVTWCQCLHACHMAVNASMHVTWLSMSPCIPRGVKCIHTYHTGVNVSIHITWW